MSKNIVIQEGGLGKQFTADKLKTNLVGGGTCLWVPEDEVQLGMKNITANGTYKASDDGYYGYSQVTVNVAGGSGSTPGGPGSSVVGRDSDGDDAVTAVDDDGDLHTTKIPSSIEVITPPTNPYGTYKDGQTISTSGMVVKAYLASGAEYGTVSIGEVTINPTTAVYDSSTDQGGRGTASSDLGTVPYLASEAATFTYTHSETETSIRVDTLSNFESGRYFLGVNGNPYMFARSNVTNYDRLMVTTNKTNGETTERTVRSNYNSSRVGSYYATTGFGTAFNEVIMNFIPNYTGSLTTDKIAEILFTGEKEEERYGSHQTITVSWPRPGDGKVLESSFEILVAPGYGGEE